MVAEHEHGAYWTRTVCWHGWGSDEWIWLCVCSAVRLVSQTGMRLWSCLEGLKLPCYKMPPPLLFSQPFSRWARVSQSLSVFSCTYGSGFLQAGWPSCHPTNSVRALKETQSVDCSHWPGLILSSYTTRLLKELALLLLWWLSDASHVSCYSWWHLNLGMYRISGCISQETGNWNWIILLYSTLQAPTGNLRLPCD